MQPRLARRWVGANTPFIFHAGGWVVLTLLVFLQPAGLIAADTKLDLSVDPKGFLAGALDPYSDIFPLGQLQNQAYGYLFPQGTFFVLTDFLPDWIAQRLWWALVLSVGFSGMLALSRRVGLDYWPAVVAATAFSLSPRTLTTLTAISSETWPVMLAPWVLYPLLRPKLSRRAVAAAVIPVALMGAVNATATIAACLPAAVVLVYRREFKALGTWLIGCALVSTWWLGPLVILGKYAPPFTEFIESSFVTTRWLNLPELLRGTTSWSPFVDTERQAGHLLVAQPTFVLVTALVAAVSLAGLTRAGRVFKLMALAGLVIMGCHFSFYLQFLDGPGVFMRNLHKFDPLVRLPLALGLGYAVARLRQRPRPAPGHTVPSFPPAARRSSAVAVIVMLLAMQTAPAWSGRLLPQGAYEKIPDYWYEAADFINHNAAHTRTLIYPARPFAREDWGWTRDEPAQPLLDVPWVVRDAIPLVPPESIRGLDGVMAAVSRGHYESLKRLGIGAIISREELPESSSPNPPAANVFTKQRRFGPLTVAIIDPQRDILLARDNPVRVAGGGESLAFIPGPAQLVSTDAQVVTDTPLLIDRNYGAAAGASAPLTGQEAPKVRNRLRDYPSKGQAVRVVETGGTIAVSSSWADATALETTPAASATAAVDGRPDTFWWPAPGDLGWLEFSGSYPARTKLTLSATKATTVLVRNGDAAAEVSLRAKQPQTVTVPGGATNRIRIQLQERVGLNAQVPGHEIRRVVRVPNTSPQVEEFFFQQLLVDTLVLIREFTAPRDMVVTLDANRWVTIDGKDYFPGQRFTLPAGPHHLETRAKWLHLRTDRANWPAYTPSNRTIEAKDYPRLLVTGRAFNPGLQGFLDGRPLSPRSIDASTQAFEIPAGSSGHFTMSFAATGSYRLFLLGGGAMALLTLLVCALLARGLPPVKPGTPWDSRSGGGPVWVLALLGWPAALGAAIGWAAARWSGLRPAPLAGGLMAAAGTILARGPWGSGAYAGDFWLTVAFAAAAVAVAVQAAPPNNN